MKRKKKDEDDNKEPKPKKYKKKIENPEKKKARYVYDNKANNGKVWEKNRRDRLNTTFDELALLLPPKEPPGKMSKVEILVSSINEIKDLRKKLLDFEQSLNGNKGSEDKNYQETIKIVPEIKDVGCNTDIPLIKPLFAHKKIQAGRLRKKRKLSDNKDVVTKNVEKSNKDGPSVTSSTTQTQDVTESDSKSLETSVTATSNVSQLSKDQHIGSLPFSVQNLTSTQTIISESVDPIQITSNTASNLCSSMRITPALISTPIMTPSLFISNYPIVVSQIPQPVLIVNKTEINTTVNTVNKVVAVKSKSITGRVPLPPLKKSVAVKKPPRKKRVLKKKDSGTSDSTSIETSTKNSASNENNKNQQQPEEKVETTIVSEPLIQQNKEISAITTDNKKIEENKDVQKPIGKNIDNEKPQEEIPLPMPTPMLISSGKLLERLDSNSSLLNLEGHHRKSFSPVTQDNDTSAISNLDIESFSLLTANILSGIDTSETNLSSNLGKILDVKDHECQTKTSSSNEVLSSTINHKKTSIGKESNVIEKEVIQQRPREMIQVKKDLLQQVESKIASQPNAIVCSDTIPISSYNYSNTLPVSTQSNNYPNFALSLSQDMRSKSKYITDTTSIIPPPKTDISTSYTMNSYSSNLNYSGYFSNSNNHHHTNLQQLYTNQHSNNIMTTNYSKSYDPQRSYYTDQPSTNFTFSLTSASKSQSKYVSSKSQNMNYNPVANNVQESCKKFNSSKSTGYNYAGESNKNITSHSITRLNSKYDNHKENDTPFYLSDDTTTCKKTNVVQKAAYNQTSFTNNSSCARYPQHQQSSTKQPTNKNVKSSSSSSLNNQQPQMSSRYDIDWMSSSEIKTNTNDFPLFPSLDPTSMNQNTYYPSSISNFDTNRKASDLYFAHPPGEENLPWSPSKMTNILDAPPLGSNQCFSSTLPNLHGDLALNTLTGGSSSRQNNVLETPTKASYNTSYSSVKETKKVGSSVDSQQNNSFSVRQLVDMNQSTKSSVPSDKLLTKRKTSNSQQKDTGDNYSSDIIPYENQKSNIYSAEALINPRNGSKNKSWHAEAGMSSIETNQNNSLFTMDTTSENQNYGMSRYEPKLFNQNYVSPFVDNSFSNASQNFHNFSKSQSFIIGDSNNSTIDYHQSSLGNSMSTFLSHHETPEKLTQHYYPQSSKIINPMESSRNNQVSSAVVTSSHTNKKSSKSHHVPTTTTTHHGIIMNYDFPVTPVTPSLSYFSTHDWKNTTPTEPYPTMHHNPCNSNAYSVNSPNFYSQNILQNSQTQNLVTTGISSNHLSNNNNGSNNNSQNTSNSLTNFNLSTICPEINDKVRHQNW